jgi:hypothetical protein
MTLQKSQLEASQNINQIVEGRVKEKTFQLLMYLHSLINRGQGNNTVQYTKTFNNKII